MRYLSASLLFGSFAYASTALADRCADLARPKSFTHDSAMAAVFCAYDQARGGTLLPVEWSESWNVESADYLVMPILTATYREGGRRMGVLVAQKQQLLGGGPTSPHAAPATISVYVFAEGDTHWALVKSNEEVFIAGAFGHAPAGELVKLGPDRFGLWFEGGDVHQGYTNNYAFIVTLSEPHVSAVGEFETGATNQGACSDDPKYQADRPPACWGYDARPEFYRTDDADYHGLRISYRGTRLPDFERRDEIIAKDQPVCYAMTGGKYLASDDPKCADHPTLPRPDVFDVGTIEDRKQPRETVPYRLP